MKRKNGNYLHLSRKLFNSPQFQRLSNNAKWLYVVLNELEHRYTGEIFLEEGEIMARELTPKQKRFVEEYLIDLNATQAAIRAGYSPKTANEIGANLLAKISVRAHIDKAIAERSKRTGINQDRVIQELARIALVNPPDVIDAMDATIKADASRDDTAAIIAVKVKKIPTQDGEIVEREVKMADKIKALELLGKHLGMFKDRVDINANMQVQIVDDVDD